MLVTDANAVEEEPHDFITNVINPCTWQHNSDVS